MTFSLEGEPDRQMRMCSRALGDICPHRRLPLQAVSGPAQGELPQGGQGLLGQKVPFPSADGPGPQARQKVGGLQIDDLHLVSRVKDLVRDALRGGEAGDGGDHIAQAFQLLHIHGGIDVNARAKQLGNILVALGGGLLALGGPAHPLGSAGDGGGGRRPGQIRPALHREG